MKSLAKRRCRNICIFLAAVVVALLLATLSATALRDTARLSGWVLLVLVFFLASYNVRKKLPFLPLGSSAAWLQFHIYTGLLTAALFGIHIGWRVPGGVFESVLALLYTCTFASGVFGLIVSRSFARRLTTRGREVLFERISIYRKRLQSEVEEIVLQCLTETESTAIPQFYSDRLKPFFSTPRNFWQHLLQSNRPRHVLLAEINAYDRYLNPTERQTMSEIAGHVKTKDDLDYQYALQAALKYWLFAHVPLTYALLVFAVFHMFLVHAFSGGVL